MAKGDSQTREDLAEDRTDLAEDRTIMANERTYAGWMRTGLAAAGVGLALQAIFGEVEPTWAARTIASLFVMAGGGIIFLAQSEACRVIDRLNANRAAPLSKARIRAVARVLASGCLGLLVFLWLIPPA